MKKKTKETHSNKRTTLSLNGISILKPSKTKDNGSPKDEPAVPSDENTSKESIATGDSDTPVARDE